MGNSGLCGRFSLSSSGLLRFSMRDSGKEISRLVASDSNRPKAQQRVTPAVCGTPTSFRFEHSLSFHKIIREDPPKAPNSPPPLFGLSVQTVQLDWSDRTVQWTVQKAGQPMDYLDSFTLAGLNLLNGRSGPSGALIRPRLPPNLQRLASSFGVSAASLLALAATISLLSPLTIMGQLKAPTLSPSPARHAHEPCVPAPQRWLAFRGKYSRLLCAEHLPDLALPLNPTQS